MSQYFVHCGGCITISRSADMRYEAESTELSTSSKHNSPPSMDEAWSGGQPTLSVVSLHA